MSDEDEGIKCCHPADNCCCGCSIDAGIQLILVLHSLSSMFYMATTVSNIVFEYPTFGASIDADTQVTNCFLAICSVPFIISGFSGINNQVEIHLRIYLYWLVLSFLMDVTFSFIVLIKQTCVVIPGFMRVHGGSFACGAQRIMGAMFMIMLLIVCGYCTFMVWSKCQELQANDSEKNFDVLLGIDPNKEAKAAKLDPSGLFGTGVCSIDAHPVIYGSVATPAFGGSVPLWNAKTHCIDFPPAAHKKQRK